MVTRIVKMTFKPERCDEFLEIFDRYKHKIRAAEGCHHLELLRLTKNGNVFFTYSRWQEEKYLEIYKNSPTFAVVWPQTKALFESPAEAWTTDAIFVAGADVANSDNN